MNKCCLWIIFASLLMSSSHLRAQGYYLPSDAYFSDQWQLHNEGPFRNRDGKGAVKGSDHAHIAEAWQELMNLSGKRDLSEVGKSIRLAIIDDGFDLEHEDLKGKYIATKNFGSPVIPGNLFSQQPRNVHGTLVTGLAAAIGDNGVGIVGACPGCRIIAARMSEKAPPGMTQEDYLGQVFDWVISQKPDIINCSWGADGQSPRFWAQLMEKLSAGRDGKGIILVAAAGNDGRSLESNGMASHPYAITVGASSSLAKRYSYSRYGAGIDVLAPSSKGSGGPSNYVDRIYTTDNYLEPDCLIPGRKANVSCSDRAGLTPHSPVAGGDGWEGRYSYRFSHTSAAAPLVSGVAGLILTANPELEADEVQQIIQSSADKIEPEVAKYDRDGWSVTHGYGRLNGVNAVRSAW
ncbi:MAG: hypothetical protein CMP10_19105 [Zetaproteobacteria bacterium]|nr:hypothetical protein [Pseudobdellovibrionaceae bacterium]